jgi:hypothetical protein
MITPYKPFLITAFFLLFATSTYAYVGAAWHFTGGNVTMYPVSDPSPKAVCLQDGTNCPANSTSGGGGGFTQWNLAASNGTAGSVAITNDTLVQFVAGNNIIITRNGSSIVINSTATAAGGSGNGNVTGGGVAGTLTQWYNTTHLLALSYPTLYGNITGNIMNWSSDRPNYVNFTVFNQQNNLSLAQIVANIQNWSADRNNYVNYTSLYSILNGQNNLTLAQIVTNIGNWSLDRPSYVNFTVLGHQTNLTLAQVAANVGNWSADRATYLQNNTHANFTKLSINTSQQVTYNGSCFNFTGATSQWLVC